MGHHFRASTNCTLVSGISFHPTPICDPFSMPHYTASGITGFPMVTPNVASVADPTAILDFSEFADLAEFSQSQPSSAYSGSPAHSGVSLPVAAPQPRPLQEHIGLSFETWRTVWHGCIRSSECFHLLRCRIWIHGLVLALIICSAVHLVWKWPWWWPCAYSF